MIHQNKYISLSHSSNFGFIRNLKSIIDLEISNNVDYIKQSKKIPIIYNNGIHLNRQQERSLWLWCQQNNKLAYVLERASLPNMIILDKNGMLADSISYNEEFWNKPLTKEENAKVEQYINEFVSNKISLEKQPDRLRKEDFFKSINVNVNKIKKIIFVPLQVGNDTTILMWSDWIENVFNFLNIISQIADKNKNILFLIKPHPGESKVHNIIETENFKNVARLNYKDCINYCDKVFVINSGVGLQSMMWKKQTFIFGKSHYQFEKINKKINNLCDIDNALIDNYVVDEEKMKRYIYYLKFILWSDCDFSQGENNCRYINIRMN